MSGPAGSSQWMYQAGADYDIPYSARFEQGASTTFLSKTYGSDGNRRTWTFSCWLKRAANRARGITDGWSNNYIFTARYGGDGSNETIMGFNEHGYLQVEDSGGAGGYMRHKTEAEFRDANAWYNIVVACDTTQATEANRFKLYINGVEKKAFRTEQHQTQNNYTGWGAGQLHYLGGFAANPSAATFRGLLAECHFLDGVAITANSFGEFGDYGEWKPKEYDVTDGAYGTNGFYMDFADAGNLGNDVSGNNNDYATTEHGSGYDTLAQSIDSPTNNFCTLNLARTTYMGTSETLDYGNTRLRINNGGDNNVLSAGTFAMTSGKWYWEAVDVDISGNDSYTQSEIGLIGVSDEVVEPLTTVVYKTTYDYEGATDNLSGATFATYAEDDIIGVAYNADDDEITFYKNNAAQTTTSLQATDSKGMEPLFMGNYQGEWRTNFGQDSSFSGAKTSGSASASDGSGNGDFYYTPPTGFKALCTKNLSTPSITPSEHFKTVTWIGDSDTSRAITGVGFQPDFVWIKQTNGTCDHRSFDAVRGAQYTLRSNSTAAEVDDSQMGSFDSDGFELGNDSCVNYADRSFIAWNWKAGNATLGTGDFTQGNAASTCSRNVDAGFSIVSYTGNSTANRTVGHGLSKAPEMIIIKNRDDSDAWMVYHEGAGTTGTTVNGLPEYYVLFLSASSARTDYSADTIWGSTATTFMIDQGAGGAHSLNLNTEDYIAYCFHSVEGYSKLGKYEGNGSSHGVFVNCGFRPAYVLIKCRTAGENWVVFDSSQHRTEDSGDTYNETDLKQYPNITAAQSENALALDLHSNGFHVIHGDTQLNDGSHSYVYYAVAAIPQKYANAY